MPALTSNPSWAVLCGAIATALYCPDRDSRRARSTAQEPAPNVAEPASAQEPAACLGALGREGDVGACSQAFPNGLDSLEVCEDRPGRHPLVVLTHGTAEKPEDRAHVTPWAQAPVAQWFARRGYVAIVVVRRDTGAPAGTGFDQWWLR